MKLSLLIILLPGLVASASAQHSLTIADSTAIRVVKKNSRATSPVTYILPAAMITYGFVALKSKPLIQFDQNIKQATWDNHPHQRTRVDDYLWAAPAVSVYILNIAGIKGQHTIVDRSIILGLSYAIAGAVVVPTKQLTKKWRPDGSNRFSFPSGHTEQAFVAAEFLRMEYRAVSPWYGVAGYAVAATTGYLRMYNNKHWFSDVVAGAGIGILSVQAAYRIYPKLKQKLIKQGKGTTMLIPYYHNRQGGLLCIIQTK